jgi:hypothetical protein
MGCRLRFGRAAWQRARNRSRFPFGLLRSTHDRTLARLAKNAPLEKEGTSSKSPEDKSISLPIFPSGDSTGAERETSQARAFSRFLGAPPSGRSEAERLDTAPALRTIVQEKMGFLACLWTVYVVTHRDWLAQ